MVNSTQQDSERSRFSLKKYFSFIFAVSPIAGDVNERIVGGTQTTIEQHPHQLSLRDASSHICGGAIITQTRGVTAAHCFQRSTPPWRYNVQVGSTLRLGDDNAQVRPLLRYLEHPNHNTTQLSYDIALLYWFEPFIFGKNIRAIALPTQDLAVPYGEMSTTTGWGRHGLTGPLANMLHVVEKRVVNSVACNLMYAGRIRSDMFCAGGEAGRGACYGDSGDPVVHGNLLIGLVSWSRPCGVARLPTVNCRVASFVDWIRQNI